MTNTCPLCGRFKEADFELCRRCEKAQDRHPEEMAARDEEVVANVTMLVHNYVSAVFNSSKRRRHVDAAMKELIDYVLGLLK